MLLRLAGLATLVLLAATGCDRAGPDDGRVGVVTAFYPLTFTARTIGASAVDVTDLTPPGVEPHDLELSPGQVGDLAEADLVVYLGHGFQPAVDDAVAQLDAGKTLDALEGEDLLTPAEEAGSDVGGITEPETDAVDAHVWLDPVRMKAIADRVRAALDDIKPATADLFELRADALDARLDELDHDYSTGLARCDSRTIVTSHAAFGYLADRYDLTQISVSGLDPQAEPTPGRLAEIARFVEAQGITTIFSEELAPPEVAETLSREAGASIEVLSPLESAPASGNYFTAMRQNLDRIRKALGCE